MQNNNRFKLIVIIAVLVLSVGVIFARMIYLMWSAGLKSSKTTIVEYTDLFKPEALKKLQLLATVESANRNPISNYLYEGKYYLEVFKISLATDRGLGQVLTVRNQHAAKITEIVTPVFENALYELSYNVAKTAPTTAVNCTFEGDSVQVISKGTNQLGYYLKLGTFSIGYGDQWGNDLWAGSVSRARVPFSFMFVQKRKSLYLIFLNVNDDLPQQMKSDLLMDVVKN
jgi:hypothetical protein